METISTFTALVATFGGYELVKYLLQRRSNSRIARAHADTEEFHALREYNEFLQQQLLDTNRRHASQTRHVRSLQTEILELTRLKCAAEAELALKRCEKRGCPHREPQNGF